MPELSLPPCRLRVTERAGRELVWDPLRRRWLVLTPEEWVRRHVIAYLERLGAPAGRICQEYPVDVNGQPQRADIVVTDGGGRPLLVVECKAPEVELTPKVYAQAVRYNAVLGARYLALSNGKAHLWADVSDLSAPVRVSPQNICFGKHGAGPGEGGEELPE